MVEVEHVARSASRGVIGEVYLVLQHHDGVSKPQAKAALRSVPSSGMVAASGVDAVLDALAAPHGGGLLDRLIVLQYGREDPATLTLDRKMAALPKVERMLVGTASRATGRPRAAR